MVDLQGAGSLPAEAEAVDSRQVVFLPDSDLDQVGQVDSTRDLEVDLTDRRYRQLEEGTMDLLLVLRGDLFNRHSRLNCPRGRENRRPLKKLLPLLKLKLRVWVRVKLMVLVMVWAKELVGLGLLYLGSRGLLGVVSDF